MKSFKLIQSIFIILLSTTIFVHCEKQTPIINQQPKKPVVTNNGSTISFPQGSKGLELIKTSKLKHGEGFIDVTAPSRIATNISSSVNSKEKIILFENAEITALYAQYKQSRVQVMRASKNLNRIRDMYKNLVATEKDIIEVETEIGNARATMAEAEGKLRAIGFDPSELEKAKTGSVWIICDVPESSLHSIKKGQPVNIHLSSFPELKLSGFADAIGDNVDPITRTAKVRVVMDNKENKFKPGMFAKVTFGTTAESSTIILPVGAVITVESKDYVFVKTSEGVFEKRKVITAYSNLESINILEGVSNEEEVVTSGTILLKGLSFGY